MRRSVWLLPLAALSVWAAAVAYPIVASAIAFFALQRSDVEFRHFGELLVTSSAWSAAVALGAIVLGWAPGRLLGKSIPRRGFAFLATLLLAPICLPAYVVFYAWWQSWPAGSFVHDWALKGGTERVLLMRHATLYLGLVCWSWPIVAWCTAGSVATTPAEREERLRIDGAGPIERLKDRFRCDRGGLALGGFIVLLMTFNNTTCFDLAQIFTFGNELRANEALGANPRDTLQAGLGPTAFGLLGAVVLWVMMSRRLDRPALRTLRPSRAAGLATGLIWLIAVGAPFGLMMMSIHGQGAWRHVQEFAKLYGPDFASSVGLAMASGAIGALVAAGMLVLWQDERRWVRGAGHVVTLGWLLAALAPGTLVGVALEAAYNLGSIVAAGAQSAAHTVVAGASESNTQLLERVYRSPVIVILGHLARFGFIAALLSRWLAQREAPTLRDLRRLDGDRSLVGLLRATGPRLLAAAGGTVAVTFVLSLSETAVTAQVHPASTRPPISVAILNAMHYQRPLTVMIGSMALIGFAIIAAVAVLGVGAAARRLARGGGQSGAMLAGLGLVVAIVGGCAPSGEPDTPLDAEITFGVAGQAPGQFNYPRAIAVDDANQYVYVVDKTARVQRFDFDGHPLSQWRMPEWALGKPTGMSVGPDGNVYVADTHYFRVVVYDGEGHELRRFGSYGQEPGQFIYPTDVAFGPNGELYVSEYGGNDRVQVFTPEGKFLFTFGSFGSETGQFNRPQSLVFSADKSELYITDACNHRIVVVDPQGHVLRQFGEAGRAPGQLSYPYGMMLLGDGSLLVCEFGNNRLQQFSPAGQSLGVFGRVGFDRGELQYPWGVDGTEDEIFVVDSGNNRVQRFRSPA